MQRGFWSVLGAVLVLAPSNLSAQSSAEACDTWARSAEAWPEVERILRQNYAYLGRVADPDAFLAKAAANAAEVTGAAELGAVTERLGYAFRDGHFHVYPITEPQRAWIPSSSDFWVEGKAGRWLVSDVRRDSAAYLAGLRPGWEVVGMDGRPIAELARAALSPLVSHPNPEQLEYAVNLVTTGRLGAGRSFGFSDGEAARKVDLPPAQQSIAPRPPTLFTRFDHGKIVRIRFNNSLGDNPLIPAFDAAMADLGDAEALILDLRDTPGGGNTTIARAILGHFVGEAVVYQVHQRVFEQAVFGVPRQYAEYVFPRGRRWDRPVVVLAGRWTGSVGEALAMAFDRAANVTTIGTPLADLLGTLEANPTENRCLELKFAWDSLYAPDGTPREDWAPRVALPAGDTASDGSDPALAAALAMLEDVEKR